MTLALFAALLLTGPALQAAPTLADYFPPSELQGGWRTLLPESGTPDDGQKAEIKRIAGVDHDKLAKAWAYNIASGGKTGMLVIRRGQVVGEWYRDCDKKTDFNIYSSSKAYTSLAYGLILKDFGGTLPGGKELTLDTKVLNAEWVPEALPLTDPRKADVTVRHLLNMTGGFSEQNAPRGVGHFEWMTGHVDKSPMATLKGDPGTTFHYSNAGVAHLVLAFQHATGKDLFPYLKERIFDPIGEAPTSWNQVGGDGKIGPLSQGYSGLMTNAREHARFCHLAMHKGEWAGKRLVPASYYDFAWKGTKVNPGYGAQWWVQPRFAGAPADIVQTAGARNNSGFVVPSLDLVFVRTGDGNDYPKGFEGELVKLVLAAVE